MSTVPDRRKKREKRGLRFSLPPLRLRFRPAATAYFIVLLATTAVISWLYHDIDRTFEKVYAEFIRNQIQTVEEFAGNIQNQLKTVVPDHPVERLGRDEALRKRVNEILGLFSNNHFRYVYLLYLDRGKLRYLADGSWEIGQRGLFGQKFDPDNDVWADALREKKPVYSMQKDFTGLWLTYYYPLTIWKEPKTLLVFDISIKAYQNFNHLLTPIKKLLKILSIALIVLLIVSLVWSLLFYLQRRRNSIDPLTHLYNRNLLLRIREHLDLSDTSVILLDIDHFKRVNDRYGHDTGDRVLVHVARILQRFTRADDIVIRYGGEEFLIFVVGLSDRNEVIRIAQRIHGAFPENPVRIGQEELNVTVSTGVVPVPGSATDISEAIRLADKMLYIAKTSGRNKIVVYGEENIRNRSLLFAEISRAIADGRLFFHFQPIVATDTGKPVRYETLARLRGEDGRIYLPAEFIPAIRGTQAYRDLSKQLLEGAITTCLKKKTALSINFDINDFLDETLFEMLYDRLAQNPEAAKLLSVELLEEHKIDDFSLLSEKTRRLQELGIKIALDDYGRGYAGLNYLLHFHPDVVKMDRTILAKAMESPLIVTVLQSLQQTASIMGIKTVAEGIENGEMADLAIRIGFDCLQGYYFGRPSETLHSTEGDRYEA
ncbi:bifunctional diguanylate cyclase/phosphodiesterase [Hydrogenimonas sp. SS33]|uniref:bifunctional diguanylate cyclase/phosphodiesterase n=1 Tax=Hydrogenimonas leucolamina TaxID=2954236 RepID=UPI00336BBABD